MKLTERFRNLLESRSPISAPDANPPASKSPSQAVASNPSASTSSPQQSLFLQLPGEIRNLIYNHAVYPDLELLTIANCVIPAHFGTSVLSLPVFRVCRQIRVEALAVLCATKSFKIIGLPTANAFFDVVGTASEGVKSVYLVQNGGGVIGHDPEVERFMGVIEGAKGLKTFGLEGIGDWYVEGQWAIFVRRVRKLREKGVEVTTKVGDLG